MALQLRFSDKYRLWAELIQSGVDRIFVDSETPFALGSEVPVELVLPELPLHIVMLGEVVGLRPSSERFKQGVYGVQLQITLDNAEELQLPAEVSWARAELGLLGLKFLDLPPDASNSIGRCIVRLSRLREMASDAGHPILVAEDEVSVLGFLVKVLTKHGYQVQTATRGDDAIAMIRKHHPKLVLLDVLMPGIDGKDICQRMRADADMADIPVILMSALDAANLHAIAAETGASDYICKPVSMADLLTMVGKYAVP